MSSPAAFEWKTGGFDTGSEDQHSIFEWCGACYCPEAQLSYRPQRQHEDAEGCGLGSVIFGSSLAISGELQG